jgi:hypothetical protein
MAVFNLLTGDYVFNGCIPYGKFTETQLNGVQIPPSIFEPQQMAANASF